MARLSQMRDPDEAVTVRITKLSAIALADLRDLCDRERLPIDMRVKGEYMGETVVELMAPYRELIQYLVWLFSREYEHMFEVEATR